MNPFRSQHEAMGPLDHLEELRWRIIYSLTAITIFTGASFFYSSQILAVLTRPVPKLVMLTPAEAFLVHLKIALIAGAAVSAPFILYQLLLFVLPALTTKEKKGIIWIVPAGILLFFCGAAFANFVLLPAAIKFFLSYTSDKIEEMISLSNYTGFVLSFLVGGGIAFELPLLMMALGKFGIVRAKFLGRRRKEAILIILILTALLSPSPDVFSWSILSVSLYLLFELSILLVRFVEQPAS